MAELKKLIIRRKTIRSRVTKSHNRLGTYKSLSKEERAMELSNLTDFKEVCQVLMT